MLYICNSKPELLATIAALDYSEDNTIKLAGRTTYRIPLAVEAYVQSSRKVGTGRNSKWVPFTKLIPIEQVIIKRRARMLTADKKLRVADCRPATTTSKRSK